jgi:hypothetical protein
MIKPSIKIGCASNIFIRMILFHNKHDTETNIITDFDHIALLATGAVKVIVTDIETTFSAPHMFLIKKGILHEFCALEDNTTIYQVHTIKKMNSDDVLDPEQIPYECNPRLLSSRPL